MPISAPSDLSNLVVWYDASDATTFTFHSGALVSQWNDKSGAARHLSQATSGSAPSRNVTSPAGPTAVRFNSKNMMTANVNGDYITGTTATYAFVAKRDADSGAANGRFVVGFQQGFADYEVQGAMIFDSTTGCPSMYRDPGTQVDSSPSMSVGDWAVIIGVWDGTSFTFYVNGVSTGTGLTSGSFNIDRFALGSNNSNGEYGNNSIAEVAIYSDAKGSTDITSLTDYLAAKWLDGSASAGAVTGVVGWVGSSTGARASAGAATGAVGWSGTVTGARPSAGAATGAIGRVGAATGVRAAGGTASGAVAWDGTSTGARTPVGAVSGAVSWAGEVDGEAPTVAGSSGSADGTIGWVGTVAGSLPAKGSGDGAVSWAGAAIGEAPVVGGASGAAVGSVGWAGVVAGARASGGVVAGSIGWDGAATGEAPVIGGAAGAAIGAIVWSGIATGTRGSAGAAVGAVTWVGLVTGVDTPGNPYASTGKLTLRFLDPETGLRFTTVEPALRFLTEA